MINVLKNVAKIANRNDIQATNRLQFTVTGLVSSAIRAPERVHNPRGFKT